MPSKRITHRKRSTANVCITIFREGGVIEAMDALAKERETSRSQIIRDAIEEYMKMPANIPKKKKGKGWKRATDA